MSFQTPLTIKQVIEKIDKREFLLPAIQREFVWGTDDIELLFDSLMCDFPINSFLFWKVGSNQNKTNYKYYQFLTKYVEYHHEIAEAFNTGGIQDFYAVLDGQQRLTALYLGLKGTYAYKTPYARWENIDNFPERKLYLDICKKYKDYTDDEIKNIDVLDLELSDNFIMYGAWNRPENYDGLLWFLREVMPHISIKITIIGGGMPENIRTILGTLNVKYLGFVENPYIHISESRGLIAPLFQGAGVKVKVIESLALGTPVVGTEVAFEGIPNLISRNAMIRCESSEEFIRSLNSFSTSVIEKHEIQKEFNERYSNAKFKNFLNTL